MAYEWPTRRDGAPEGVACSDVTGLSCDFIAQRDWTPDEVRGDLVAQVISQMSFHVARSHPGHALNTQMRAELRARLSGVRR